MSNMSDQAGRSMQRMERRITGVTSTLRDYSIIVNQAAHALNMMRTVMVDWMGSIIRSNAEIQRMTFLIRGLSSAAESSDAIRETAENFEYLISVAQNAPFTIAGLTDTFVKMRSVGIDPTSGSMQSLVDAVASFGGTEETLHRASIAIQQMAGKGVISMEELRQQLGEAVPTALPMLARALGMTMDDLVDNISQGRVRAQPALAALFNEFNRAFGGAAIQMMDTFSGQMSRVQTQLRLFALDIGGFNHSTAQFTEDGLMGQLTEQLREITGLLSDPRAVQFARDFGQGMIDAANGIKAFLVQMYEARDTIVKVAQVLGTLMSIRLIIGLAVSLGSAMGSVNRAVLGFLGTLANGVNQTRRAMASEEAYVQSLRQRAMATHAASRAAVTENLVKIESIKLTLAKSRATANAAFAEATARRNEALQVQRITGQMGLLRQRTAELMVAKQGLIQQERREAFGREALSAATDRLNAAEARATTTGNRLNVVMQGTSRSARLAAGAMTALRGATSFLLGWGGLILSIGAVALSFLDLETATDRAARALRDFNDTGLVSDDNMTDMEESIRSQTTAMETALTAYNQAMGSEGRYVASGYGPNGMAFQAWTDEERQALHDNYERFKTELEAQNVDLLNMRQAYNERQGEISANNQMRALLREEANLRRTHRVELERIYDLTTETANNAALDTAEREQAQRDNEALRVEEVRWFGQQLIDMYASTAAAQQALYEGMEETDRNTPTGLGVREYIDRLLAKAQELRAMLPQSISDAIVDLDTVLMDGDNSPVSRLTTQLEELRIEARTTGDAVADATASIVAGLVEGIGNDPKTSAAVEYLNIVREIAELEDQIKQNDNNDRALARLGEEATRASASASEMMDTLINGGSEANSTLSRSTARLEAMRRGFVGNSEAADRLFGEAMSARRLELAVEGLTKIQEETRRMSQSMMTEGDRARSVYEERIAEINQWRDLWVEAGQDVADVQRIVTEAQLAAQAELDRSTETASDRMIRDWRNVTQQMQDAQGEWIGDFIDSMAEGEFSFGEFTKNILKDILKIQLQARLAPALNSLMNGVIAGIGGMFGGGATASAAATPSFNLFAGNHGGGIVGKEANFHKSLGLPQYHQGGIAGLGSNEVLSVLEKDEGVFTKEQMRAMGGGGFNGNMAPQIDFNVINQSSQDVRAEQQGSRFDGERFVVDIVLKNLAKPGSMRNAIKGLQ